MTGERQMNAEVYIVSLDFRNYGSLSEYRKSYAEAKKLEEAGFDVELKERDESPWKEKENGDTPSFEIIDVVEAQRLYLNSRQMLELVSTTGKYTFEGKVTVDLGEMFRGVSEKSEQAVVSEENYYNQKCEVHLPGNMLATYNEVLLLEDVCTDELQRSLDNGYRIITACPQPNQRRPDYILGRFNPNKECDGRGAERRGDEV